MSFDYGKYLKETKVERPKSPIKMQRADGDIASILFKSEVAKNIIDEIRYARDEFIYKFGFEPEKIICTKDIYIKMCMECNRCDIGNYRCAEVYGLYIELDDNIDRFEVIGYKDFLGVNEIVR